MSELKILHAIICDDVRREDNGKLIVIGAYASNILVQKFPANLALSMLLAIEARGKFTKRFSVRVRFQGRELAKGEGKIQNGDAGEVLVSLPRVPVGPISENGKIEFAIKIENGKWQKLKSIGVELATQPVSPQVS